MKCWSCGKSIDFIRCECGTTLDIDTKVKIKTLVKETVRTELKLDKLPKPYFQDDAVTIYHADCRDILPLIPDKRVYA